MSEEINIKDEDDPTCIRCGGVLDTAEGIQTGICANCWKPETDEEVEWSRGEWKPKLEWDKDGRRIK
jgi:predicted amidophosphoribosyltransferase